MKEQLQALGQRLLKNIDRVAVVTFLVLLLVSGGLFLQERAFTPPDVATPPPQEWDVKIPSEEYEEIEENFLEANPSIDQDALVSRLYNNPFEPRSMESEAEITRRIEADYQIARQLVAEEKFEEAARMVESILRRNPTHRRSLELQEQIAAAMASGEAEAQQAPPGAVEGMM